MQNDPFKNHILVSYYYNNNNSDNNKFRKKVVLICCWGNLYLITVLHLNMKSLPKCFQVCASILTGTGSCSLPRIFTSVDFTGWVLSPAAASPSSRSTTLSVPPHNGLQCQRRAKLEHLLDSAESVYGFNDDEKEEIQVQGGLWAGRALLGPLC